jgi:uncharacterized protein (DUF433 family)
LCTSTYSFDGIIVRFAASFQFTSWAPGQSCFAVPFAAASQGILKEGAEIMASLDWSQCPAVESVPGKVSGAWVLRGTRMPVSAIFENIEAGANIDDIIEWFDGLDREQVKAVIEFAARSLDKAPALTP